VEPGANWAELLPGILVLIAVGNIIWAQIKANGVAQPILREARIALFNDPEERGDQILVPHPNLRRWEHHHRFPDYVVIWRREHRKAGRRVALSWGASLFLIVVAAL
jgi:hypothetical protein